MKKFRKVTALLFVALFVFSVTCQADDYDFAEKRLGELETLTEAASGDLMLVYDSSAKKGKTMDAANPVVAGDVTFRTNLISMGRRGGASTVSSSSTNLDPVNQSYTVVRKCVGAGGGLDETGIGTELPNGTAGQVLVLVQITAESSGSWIVTPATSLVFSKITFDAVGETATLLYVNDTVGWIVMGVEGATVSNIVTDF